MFGRNVINLGVAITMRDDFTAKAQNAVNSMVKMNAAAHQLARNADKMASTGFSMLGAGAAMLLPIGNAVRSYADYSHILQQIKATTGDITDNEFKSLKDRIKEVGLESVYSINEIGEATRELARQGMPFDVMLKSIGSINDVAQATGTGLQKTSEFFSSIMAIYPETISNTDRLSSILVYSANKSRASIDALAESYNYMGASAKLNNMSIEQSMALLMRLADAGLKGSQGGTVADNLIRYYAKMMSPLASKKTLEGLGMLGLSQKDFIDEQGRVLDIDKALGLVGQRVKYLKDQGKETWASGALSVIFGERGKRAAITTEQAIGMGKNMEDYIQQLKQIDDGLARRQSLEVTNDIWGDLAKLMDSIRIFKNEVIEPLAPILRVIVRGLTTAVQAFTWLGSSKIGSIVVGLVAGLGSILVLWGGFNLLVGKGLKFIMHYGFTWGSWKLNAVGAINSAKAALLQFTMLQQRSAAMAQIQAANLRYSYTSPLGMQYWKGAGGRFQRGPQGGINLPWFLGGAGGRAAATGLRSNNMLFRFLSPMLGRSGAFRVASGAAGILGTASGIIPTVMGIVTAGSLLVSAFQMLTGKTDEAADELEKERLARQQVIQSISLNKAWQLRTDQANKLLTPSNNIVINIDGKEAMRKQIQQSDADTYYGLNFE